MGGLAEHMLAGDPVRRAVARDVLARAIEISDEIDGARLGALFGA